MIRRVEGDSNFPLFREPQKKGPSISEKISQFARETFEKIKYFTPEKKDLADVKKFCKEKDSITSKYLDNAKKLETDLNNLDRNDPNYASDSQHIKNLIKIQRLNLKSHIEDLEHKLEAETKFYSKKETKFSQKIKATLSKQLEKSREAAKAIYSITNPEPKEQILLKEQLKSKPDSNDLQSGI